MIELRQTPEFEAWVGNIRDMEARLRIRTRIHRLIQGNVGDCKHVGDRVWELRIHHGPGYRIYYTQRGREWILLLAGGDKSSQEKDIRLALKLAQAA